ncbi:paraneoplastic antigen Ma1 [Alligator mississippiensis]|uniref:Paraneoplastic antigen Ma1 n=1 Tax=Alligator mississippiensis TaxID=8496 RepID=A0A151N813_ALLMI|nr:paraneoplastic antigen Ma1 [Alligator mississippiensis]
MLEVTDEEVWAVTLVGGGPVPHPDSGGESEEPPSREAEDLAPAASGESGVGSRAPEPEWAKALGKALKEVLQPSPESVAYKRLRIFSGKDPLPPGEETFEAWHSHVTETLASWAVSEEEKRRRLLESFRDPAFAVVRMIKQENSNISVLQCLKLLSSVFGKSVQAEALFLEFNKTYQQKGETVSAYILRLERVLQQLAAQGGLTWEMAGKARLQQLQHSFGMLVGQPKLDGKC